MVHDQKSIGALVLRLIVGLALLGCARVGSAQGTWSVISLPSQPGGQVRNPTAVAADTAGNLYVADQDYPIAPIRKRDAQGNRSVIATGGKGLGQVRDVVGLAVDGAGSLYVADYVNNRVQKYTPAP